MGSKIKKARLIDLTTKIGSGATPRGGSKVYLEEGVSLIRSQNIFNNGFSREGLVHISRQHAEELNNVEVQEGDILLNITGASVGRSCQVPKFVLPARVNQHVAIIRPNNQKLDPLYLRYFLISLKMQQLMLSYASAGATRQALTKGMIESFEIPLMPIEEQRKIGKILNSFDQKVHTNQRMNETLEEIARAVFKSWFVDFDPVRARMAGKSYPLPDEIMALFPDELVESELGMIPKGWEVGELKDIIEFNPQYKLSKGAEATYLEMKVLPEKGFFPTEWRKREYKSGTKFTNGDTLLARITPCLENGKTAYINFLETDEVAWGSTEYIVMRTKGDIPNIYSYILARNESFRKSAIKSMTGSSGRQRVQKETLEELPIIIAQNNIYSMFNKLIFPLFKKMTYNHFENTALSRMRDTLLPWLMSREIVS